MTRPTVSQKNAFIQELQSTFPAFSGAQLEEIVHFVWEEVLAYAIENGRAEVRGLGVFSVRRQRPRTLKIPTCIEPIHLSFRKLLHFKASPSLLARIKAEPKP